MTKNLCTPADGVLGTHVTWSDIEEEMQKALGTTTTFGPNKKITNIGEGNGFLSRICLVEPDWQCSDGHLPKRFVMKISSLLSVLNLVEDMGNGSNTSNAFADEKFIQSFEQIVKKFHNTEVDAYSHLVKMPREKIPLATVFGTKRFSDENHLKGYILMEFMENIEHLHIFDNLSPATLKQPLLATAMITAMSTRLTDEEKASFTRKPIREIFSEFYKPDVIQNLVDSLRQFGGDRLATKVNHFEEIATNIMDPDPIDDLPDRLGITRVLCHGDLWSMNLLWRKGEGDNYSLAALIDFQAFQLGCPAFDLCQLLSSCLSGKDRREHWEELLGEYYEFLKCEIDGGSMPFTLEQLKEAYCCMYPTVGFMTISMIGPVFNQGCKTSDEEERAKKMEIVMEKTECILDDIIKYHSLNKANSQRSQKAF